MEAEGSPGSRLLLPDSPSGASAHPASAALCELASRVMRLEAGLLAALPCEPLPQGQAQPQAEPHRAPQGAPQAQTQPQQAGPASRRPVLTKQRSHSAGSSLHGTNHALHHLRWKLTHIKQSRSSQDLLAQGQQQQQQPHGQPLPLPEEDEQQEPSEHAQGVTPRRASMMRSVSRRWQEQQQLKGPSPSSPSSCDGLAAALGSLLGTPSLRALYRVQQELGQGHLGTVSLVRCSATRRLYACKTIHKHCLLKRQLVEEVTQEILTMGALQLREGGLSPGSSLSGSPFLVRLHEVLDDAQDIHLITEYCEGGDLLHRVVAKGRLGEAECADMLLQLLMALQDLHRAGFAHRDVKPENILLCGRREGGDVRGDLRGDLPHLVGEFLSHRVPHRVLHGGNHGRPSGSSNQSQGVHIKSAGTSPDSPRAQGRHKSLLGASAASSSKGQHTHNSRKQVFKLADFGSCAQFREGQVLKGFVGSPKYMAPEVVRGQEYGPEVDIWSLGVVLYSCLSGRQPFVGQEVDDVLLAVRSAAPDFSSGVWALVSPEARSLLCAMLCKDPAKRISVAQIWQHPWVRKFHGDCRGMCEGEATQLPRTISLSC